MLVSYSQISCHCSIEDILKDSDSEPDDDDDKNKNKKKSKKERKEARSAKKTGKSWLMEGGEDDIVDFMDIKASQKVTGWWHFGMA